MTVKELKAAIAGVPDDVEVGYRQRSKDDEYLFAFESADVAKAQLLLNYVDVNGGRVDMEIDLSSDDDIGVLLEEAGVEEDDFWNLPEEQRTTTLNETVQKLTEDGSLIKVLFLS